MKKENIGEYLAPEVEVIEIRNREVLCASGDTQDSANGTWTW